MTRFARSIGSKASNKKEPDEPTPWHEMKLQLEESLSKEKHKKAETKTKSAKELLDEKDKPYYSNNLGNIKTDWAEFDVPNDKNVIKCGKVEKKSKNKEKEIKKAVKQTATKESTSPVDLDNVKTSTTNQIVDFKTPSDLKSEVKQNKLKKKKIQKLNGSDSNAFENKKRKHKNEMASSIENNKGQLPVPDNESENKTKESENISKLSKRQKRNQKRQDQKSEKIDGEVSHARHFNVKGNDWDTSIKSEDKVKLNDKKNKLLNGKNQFKKREWMSDFDWKNYRRFGNNVPKKYQKKVAKVKDDHEHKRKKPDESSVKLTINGVDVDIVKYDGYPVQKEDAKRLTELRKQMVLKGIPKNDIDKAMKLERRKCEKALARIRKQVCFHCRKAGHNLSECPELGKEEAATGICFKCGSTEHTHFECKVTKSDEYRFAKCFICREQGHISKQCPDNPKGLYPDGGCCKICGDVTHLKKDCPDLTVEKEEKTIKLDTIKNGNLESLDSEIIKSKPVIKSIKKIVMF